MYFESEKNLMFNILPYYVARRSFGDEFAERRKQRHNQLFDNGYVMKLKTKNTLSRANCP